MSALGMRRNLRSDRSKVFRASADRQFAGEALQMRSALRSAVALSQASNAMADKRRQVTK
jgi:hypothetical protein